MPPFAEKDSSILAKLEQRHTVTDQTGLEATKKDKKKSQAMLEAVTASRLTAAPGSQPEAKPCTSPVCHGLSHVSRICRAVSCCSFTLLSTRSSFLMV